MSLVVQKYGGSSLSTPEHIRRAARRIQATKKAGEDVVVVVSAMGSTTDELVALAKQTVRIPPQRELDMLMTAGERISMSLLAMALHELGTPAISFTGSQSGIVTTSDHTDARILEIKCSRIQEALSHSRVVIVAGFQGVSREKEVTTLGRGGSDTTAVALAATLGADRCEILTDVDGIYSADPRIVAGARLIPHCSYEEGIEFASLGAKMHARSLEVAKTYQVRVLIGSAEGEKLGTEISHLEENPMENVAIRGVASKSGLSLFQIPRPLTDLMEVVEKGRVHLKLFSAEKNSSQLVTTADRQDGFSALLEENQIPFETVSQLCSVSLVGTGLSESCEIIPKLCAHLKALSLSPLMISANSLSISVVVREEDKERLTQLLHQTFIETK